MPKQTVTAEVEIDFKDGKKTIQMQLKESYELDDCPIDTVIMLNLINGDTLTGLFKGINEEDTMIGSLDGKHTLGYKNEYVSNYFEEIKQENEG